MPTFTSLRLQNPRNLTIKRQTGDGVVTVQVQIVNFNSGCGDAYPNFTNKGISGRFFKQKSCGTAGHTS